MYKLGRHHDRKAGRYHCHWGKLAGHSFQSKKEALSTLRGLLREPPASQREPGGPITGKPRVLDGDSIEIAGRTLHLHGVDAPELKQICTIEGKRWPCGRKAASILANSIAKRRVTCHEKNRDRYNQIVAVCYLDDGTDLGAWIVSQGWALAYRRYSMNCVDEEEAAKDAREGIWRDEFVPPWDGRRVVR